jgi:hypothetical protein
LIAQAGVCYDFFEQRDHFRRTVYILPDKIRRQKMFGQFDSRRLFYAETLPFFTL